jgi:hypothetical protein
LEQEISTYLDGIGKKTSLKPNTQYPGIHLFTDILDDHGLCQIVEEPTRGSQSVCSSGTAVEIYVSFTAISTPPPMRFQFRSFRNTL